MKRADDRTLEKTIVSGGAWRRGYSEKELPKGVRENPGERVESEEEGEMSKQV